MTRAEEKFDDVLRKMLRTPHKPNVPKPKRATKKTNHKTAKIKKPAKEGLIYSPSEASYPPHRS